MENSAPERPVLDCDRAAWVKQSLEALVAASVHLSTLRCGYPQSQSAMFQMATAGAIQGAAREIVRTLGFEPGVNLENWIPPNQKLTL
ncbi:hypothetical protein LCGC14_2613820 [marine sediment metagenome]|uniref:Uncharacterized protein n=1 Tax=marine sediment metagenome TaxID=412755 RepID=A0A0F9A5A5_9ZZZZ